MHLSAPVVARLQVPEPGTGHASSPTGPDTCLGMVKVLPTKHKGACTCARNMAAPVAVSSVLEEPTAGVGFTSITTPCGSVHCGVITGNATSSAHRILKVVGLSDNPLIVSPALKRGPIDVARTESVLAEEAKRHAGGVPDFAVREALDVLMRGHEPQTFTTALCQLLGQDRCRKSELRCQLGRLQDLASVRILVE